MPLTTAVKKVKFVVKWPLNKLYKKVRHNEAHEFFLNGVYKESSAMLQKDR